MIVAIVNTILVVLALISSYNSLLDGLAWSIIIGLLVLGATVFYDGLQSWRETRAVLEYTALIVVLLLYGGINLWFMKIVKSCRDYLDDKARFRTSTFGRCDLQVRCVMGLRPPRPDSVHLHWAPGTEVIAKYDFALGQVRKGAHEDLPFAKNDLLRIVAPTKDPNWFRARGPSGAECMVPANYVASRYVTPPSTPMPWFHGLISREDTEALLTGKPDGTFLVRASTNFPADYTLCMAHQTRVEHYRIHTKNGKLTCNDEEYFDNLTQLMLHYKRDADGLCHRLVTPLLSDAFLSDIDAPDIAKTSKVFRDAGWAIRRNDLTLGDAIGRGEFGDMLIGWYRGGKVAVKVLKHSSGVTASLLEEASLMTSLRHQNLVELLGVVLDDLSDLYLVTEYMANGNLVDYFRSRGRHQVEKAQLLQFARDICAGMVYLETKQLVHRDLAARNVLLAADLTAKVSDFGLAKHSDASSHDTSGNFPIEWTAPEALRHSRFTSASDMWSFGVLLWEIYAYGRVPYPRIPIQDVVKHIEKGYRMEPPEGCPKQITALMMDAWAFAPEQRPLFETMLTRLRAIEAPLKPSPVTPQAPPLATGALSATESTKDLSQ